MTTHASRQAAKRHAPDIAENVSAAWYRSHGAERLDVVVGTIAALAVNPLKTPETGGLISWFQQLDNAGTAATLREIWAHNWLTDPYLVQAALPLHAWLDENPCDETLRAVRAVIDAALRAGLLDLVNHADPARRSSEDLLGAVLTQMRSAGARKWLGEYPTPPEVADLMAQLVNDRLPEPGQTFAEPCAGTGGLIRATAQNIRRLGGDPADHCWVMADIDQLAVACAAANAIVWGLGDRVLAYRADALAEPDAPQKAAATRQAVLENHRRVVAAAMPIAGAELMIRYTTPAQDVAADDDAA